MLHVYLLTRDVRYEGSKVIRASLRADLLVDEMNALMERDNADALPRQANEVAECFEDLKGWASPNDWDGDSAEMIKIANDWIANNLMSSRPSQASYNATEWHRSDMTWRIVKMDVQGGGV
jgi:hypothetical protein